MAEIGLAAVVSQTVAAVETAPLGVSVAFALMEIGVSSK